jgi:hypothetical protein
VLSDLVDADVFCVVFVGAVGSALGLFGLLFRSRRWSAVGPAVCAAALAAMLAVAGLPRSFWLGPLFMACMCGAFAVLRTVWPGRVASCILALAKQSKLQWAALLVVSPVVALGWQWVTQPVFEVDDLSSQQRPPFISPDSRRIASPTVATDQGRVIPLFVPAVVNAESDLLAGDASIFARMDFGSRAIRIAPASDSSNCHGWVFTGGRYLIQGSDVETILADNNYLPATEPQPGDLILYRDSDGVIVHIGIVLTTGPNQPVLIESKWGQAGLYVHLPDAAPYATRNYSFYRSHRTGHILHGVGGADPLPPIPNATGDS